MNTDNAGDVMRRIGAIEDALLLNEPDYYQPAGQLVRLEDRLKSLRHSLTEESNDKDRHPTLRNEELRKAWVELRLRETPEWENLLTAQEKVKMATRRFESLSKRLSACQSVLKRHEQAAAGSGGHGPGQAN